MRPIRRDKNKNPVLRMLFCANGDRNAGFFLLRIFVGIAFIIHGYGKTFENLSGFVSYIGKMGIPFANILGTAAAFSEFFGGIFLSVGLFSKISSFFLTCTMFVAVFIAHAGMPFEKRELAIVYLLCSLMFMLKGGGKFSIDYLLFKNMNNSNKFII